MTPKLILILSAIFGCTGVILGAFGAHALAERLDPQALKTFHTAAQYQMYHAFALLGVGILALQTPSFSFKVPAWFFFLGVLIFSGSLYLLVATGIKVLGAITPIGGLALILGWATLAWSAWKL